MFIDGLSDLEKRRLALALKDDGYTAFLVIKHATAAVQSSKRNRPINTVDEKNLQLLDKTIERLYGYQRTADALHYAAPVSFADSDTRK